MLAFLALQAPSLPRTYVAGTLWPEVSEERARGSLRSGLWNIRRLNAGLVETQGQHLSLSSLVTVDVREAVVNARQIVDTQGPAPERSEYRALFSDILPNWSEDWLVHAREEYRQLRLRALEKLSARFAEEARFAEAVEVALRVVSEEPFRESAHRALMLALLAEGNRADALLRYQSFRGLLLDQLGLEPSFSIDELDSHALAAR